MIKKFHSLVGSKINLSNYKCSCHNGAMQCLDTQGSDYGALFPHSMLSHSLWETPK